MLIVLCHGFGADGNDLFGLARPLQSYLPSAAFVSPNGPERVEGGGYRWFDNGPNFGNVLHDVLAAAPALNTFADSELARLKLTPDRLIFVGFSQGATTVLNVGLRRKPRPIAVVAYAGARLSLENLPERFDGQPPVLLCRGSEDPQSRADDMENAVQVQPGFECAEPHIPKSRPWDQRWRNHARRRIPTQRRAQQTLR
jgi:phospholipase/carboxylesterase